VTAATSSFGRDGLVVGVSARKLQDRFPAGFEMLDG